MFFTVEEPKIQVERTRPQETVALKEAFDMYDSFSEGNVFYGRAAALMGAIVALAVVVHFL